MRKSFAAPVIFLSAVLSVWQTPAFPETRTILVDSRASVGPVLELTLSQQGETELRFGNIRPSAIDTLQVGPLIMQIDVKSNSGERYQVTQGINGSLANAQGNEIALGNLQFKTSSAKSNGTVVSSSTTVTAAPQTVFVSDLEGSSDTITAEYTLTVPPNQAPGDYSAILIYTVSSL